MINKYAKDYFRLNDHAADNMIVDDLFQNANEEVLNFIKLTLTSKKEESIYNVSLELNGVQTMNNIITYPIFDGTSFIGRIIIIEDVTEREQLREKVTLAEKIASIGLLAAGVAHEINNPLEIIFNYINYLQLEIHDNEHQEILSHLEKETKYIANIVNNLMLFSDKTRQYIDKIDLNELIGNLVNLVRYRATKENININVSVKSKPISIEISQNDIKLILLNILNNSFEAMPEGGDIYIETEEAIQNNRSFAKIVFRDTGCGIKDANPANVFLPFYTTKNNNPNNLGLGLYMSYGLLKKYDGEITVRNIEKTGCEFTIILPTKPSETGSFIFR
jgi:signal transduction histidine kinase